MPQSSITTWLKRRSFGVRPPSSPSSPTAPTAPPTEPQEQPDVETSHPPIDSSATSVDALNSAGEAPDSASGQPLPLPPNIKITTCTEEHIPALRRLIKSLLPIPYTESFFTETTEDPVIASVTRVALWTEPNAPEEPKDVESIASQTRATVQGPRSQLIAGIRCRILPPPSGTGDVVEPPVLYISTLTTSAPYRRYGLATGLLEAVTGSAVELYGATAVVAHVWEANEEALEWYQKRGFVIVGKDDTYYRRLAPRTAAFVIRKDAEPNARADPSTRAMKRTG